MDRPTILWIAVAMPTGSGKTPLFMFLCNVLKKVHAKIQLTNSDPAWLLDEASFEKMGELMANNGRRMLGIYDELSTYLAQINVTGEKACASRMILPHFYLCTRENHGQEQRVS